MSFSIFCLFVSNVFNFHLKKRKEQEVLRHLLPLGRCQCLAVSPGNGKVGTVFNCPCAALSNPRPWEHGVMLWIVVSLLWKRGKCGSFVPSLHMSGITPNLVLETQRKISVVSKPTLSGAFIAAIWLFLAFLILHLKVCGGGKVPSVMLKIP